jgi:hypothetical protein
VELFVAAFLVIVGVAAAVQASVRRPVRAVPILVSATATLLFVAVRNHYDLEEASFGWALLAFSAGACVTTFAASLVVRQPPRRSATFGVVAAGLVLPLLVSYYVLLLMSCLITGCDMS